MWESGALFTRCVISSQPQGLSPPPFFLCSGQISRKILLKQMQVEKPTITVPDFAVKTLQQPY